MEKLKDATHTFDGTQVQTTTVRGRYLGGCIGSDEYSKQVLTTLAQEWTIEVKLLAKIAHSQPHAAYAALTHGLIGRWVYHMRVMKSNAAICLQELEEAISYFLLPALTGQPSPYAVVRAVLALPARQGGLVIANPTELFDRQQQACQAPQR